MHMGFPESLDTTVNCNEGEVVRIINNNNMLNEMKFVLLTVAFFVVHGTRFVFSNKPYKLC